MFFDMKKSKTHFKPGLLFNTFLGLFGGSPNGTGHEMTPKKCYLAL